MTVDHAFRPLARHDDLVMNPSGTDLLIYDRTTHHLHQLNPSAAATWHHCDGARTVPDLAHLVSRDLGEPVSPETILLALHTLTEADLLQTVLPADDVSPRESRRSLLRRAAISGAIAVPAIVSISAPVAAAAVSCPLGQPPCNGRCCIGGVCLNGACCGIISACGDICCGLGLVCATDVCCDIHSLCDGKCCPPGQTCVNGACCFGVACNGTCCPQFATCINGECCQGLNCGGTCCAIGMRCVDGMCTAP